MSDSSAKAVLGGRYRLDTLLGSGGFGDVFAGWDLELDRPVAIKRLRTTRSDSAEAIRRFRREARVAGRLRSPHAVPVHDVGRTPDGQLYTVMEQVQGPTLRAVIERGPLPADDALRICDEICALLVEAHGAGLVHRDLKPANLMLDRVGGHPQRVRVLDFGVAKMMDGTGESTRGIVGTPAYVAPEVWAEGAVDGRTDLYAVGLMLHEMLAGAPAVTASTFHGAARVHLFDGIPRLDERTPPIAAAPILQTLIDDLTARSPDGRPPDAETARRRIAECLGHAEPAQTSASIVAVAMPADAHPTTIGEDSLDGAGLDGASLDGAGLDDASRLARSPTTADEAPQTHPARRHLAWIGALLVLVSGLVLALTRVLQEADSRREAVPVPHFATSAPAADARITGSPALAAEAAPIDAVPIDAAPIDAAPIDAGPPDAASAGDSGPRDAQAVTHRPPPARRAPPRPPSVPTITIESRPRGARIWLGDRLIGTTPLELPVESATTVVVEADGHYSKRVRLTPGSRSVRVALEPEIRLR